MNKNKTDKHPCFSAKAHQYARMHLPIAPACNIKCGYCSRKFDCVNESRPGVTSQVLTPEEALVRYKEVKGEMPHLTVVGVAGPGDALANFEKTEKALNLIRDYDPDVTFCISTNGLMLEAYVDRLVDVGVSHVTVTMNAIDPDVAAKIYEYIFVDGKKLTGIDAANYLIDKQLKGIAALQKRNIVCKVNTVIIKGINDEHVLTLVKELEKYDVFLSNLVPLIPVEGTLFEEQPVVTAEELQTIRKACGMNIKQMYHCQQCRADAVGQLNQKGHAGRCSRALVG